MSAFGGKADIDFTRLLNELRQRTTDLSESLEQQTATSKVLEVISRSAVRSTGGFETVAESSVQLCGADRAFCWRESQSRSRMLRTVMTLLLDADVPQCPLFPRRNVTIDPFLQPPISAVTAILQTSSARRIQNEGASNTDHWRAIVRPWRASIELRIS
jgi:hypothetical protein